MQVFDGIQDFFLSLGNEGCYVLALIEIAQKKGCKDDVLLCIQKGIEKNVISFNKDNFLDSNNFTVLSDVRFLEILTEKKWMKETVFVKESAIHENEYLVHKYQRTEEETGKIFTHFVTSTFDSKKHSKTVRQGKIKETRIFTVFD